MNIEIKEITAQDEEVVASFLTAYGTHLYQIDWGIAWPGSGVYVSRLFYKVVESGVGYGAWLRGGLVGVLAGRERSWDTGHFGFPVVSIDHLYVKPGSEGHAAGDALVGRFNEWARSKRAHFASAKTYPTQEVMRSLERGGFYFLEMEYTLTRSLPDPSLGDADQGIRDMRPGDEPAIRSITERAPWVNRFLIDENLDAEKGREVYVAWVKNGMKQPGNRVTVLERDGEVGGFILWSTESLDRGGDVLLVGDQELVAVEPNRRNQGLGRSLYRGALIAMQGAGVRMVKTTISTVNGPAITNQARLGFKFNYPVATFHKVFSDQ